MRFRMWVSFSMCKQNVFSFFFFWFSLLKKHHQHIDSTVILDWIDVSVLYHFFIEGFFFIPQRKNNHLTLIEKISNIVWEGQTVEIMFASRDCVVFSIILDDL